MNLKVANRLEGVGEYYFSQKLKEIDLLNRQGSSIVNLGIGSPDLPPHPDVIQVLKDFASQPHVHSYQGYRGSEILRNAFAEWYRKWFAVELDATTEILPLIGSKEGLMHICMAYLNEGDEALVPDPGYPTYRSAVQLAGGICKEYLVDDSELSPALMDFQEKDLSKVKLMFLNYPHMPTGQPADRDWLEKVLQFAIEHNILIVYDNPYSFILNDEPFSILSIKNARDNVIELNSLSKSHNLAGWRIGVLCASEQRINDVLRFKSNVDSGMFLPLQLAAAKALELGKDWYDGLNQVYRQRRLKAHELVYEILGCEYSTSQVGMFLWAKVPAKYRDGYHLSDEILYDRNVFITPGGIFGKAGEDFIRVSLCNSEEKFEEAIKRIKNAGS